MVSIACFAAWGLVMFLINSGGYAERLNIYTSTVAGCIIAVAGILRPKKFFNMHILSGMYAFTIIFSIYALFFYRSYLELMNIEAQFVLYSIPGEVDKNSFAYMLLFGFLIGIYILHQIKSNTLKSLIYLPQIFLVVLLFNAGSRQVLIMMLVFALVYLKSTMPYFLRSRTTLVRHFLSHYWPPFLFLVWSCLQRIPDYSFTVWVSHRARGASMAKWQREAMT